MVRHTVCCFGFNAVQVRVRVLSFCSSFMSGDELGAGLSSFDSVCMIAHSCDSSRFMKFPAVGMVSVSVSIFGMETSTVVKD